MKRARLQRENGFTLLEMMLSIAVFVLLATTAFALVGATTELMSEISEVQTESTLEVRFLGSVRNAFQELTPDSQIEFHYHDRASGSFDTYLCLVGAPQAFDFGQNLDEEIACVVIAAEIQPDGFIRAGLYYLSDFEFALAKEQQFSELVGLPYVELVPRMSQLSWRFYDTRLEEWQPTILDGETSLIELVIQTGGGNIPIRTVLWNVSG